MTLSSRTLMALLLIVGIAACTSAQAGKGVSASACLLTEPQWIKPPDDAAVSDPPVHSYYFVNRDHSILASASWATEKSSVWNVSGEWIKVGWFRPAGVELAITGQRLDGEAPPLESEIPCCYPTRFQATGLYFSSHGCWKVTARAAESELSFIVWVKP